MKLNTLIVAVSCLSLVTCGRAVDTNTTATPASTAREEVAAHADPDEVRVDTGMLRDLRITTAAVESRPGGESVTLLGELAVDQRTYAEVAAPATSRAIRLLAGAGDRVREGQSLAELQSSELGRARAEFVSAEAKVNLAERALARKRDLALERIVPEREVQEADADVAATRAALRSATATLAAYGVPLPSPDDTVESMGSTFNLRSPLSGTVIERLVVQGQMLDPAIAAFRIADLSRLWLTVHAFERDAVRLFQGAPARVSFPALPGQEFGGVITLVGREVSQDSRTVPVRIELQNRGDLLKPGMSAAAAVPIGASDTPILAVPVAAVQRVGDNWCVFLPKDASTFEIRRIGRGRDLGSEVEILSGLKAGETIVVDGAFLLKSQAEQSDAGHEEH